MAELRLVILCGQAPRHLYVANRLCEHADVQAIVQETGTALDWPALRKKLKPASLGRKAWRWLRDRRRYTGNAEAEFFFPNTSPALNRPDLRVGVPHINHPDLVERIRALDPDLIAVFGTSLIKGDLLTLGRLGIVNLHGGLSPHYRGADCTFWALHNGEPEQVGCTLHFINAGIDTGDLIAHVCPEVRPNDTELELFWRAVRDSATAYTEVLERLGASQPLGQAQTEKGTLYQVRDRTWRAERRLAQALKAGALAQTQLPARVRWFD
ncbi:MAG: formyl transferase [Pseudomonadota bacterium]|nr:formyl transferase [Pseudomonadota bacterium]